MQLVDMLNNIQNYSEIKKSLRVKLMAVNGNEEKLMERPHRIFEDIAMVYQISIDTSEDYYDSIQVTNAMLEKWDITEQQLNDDAMLGSYTVSSAYLLPIGQMIGIDLNEDVSNTFVASSGAINGAWIMFFPGMMASYAKQLGSKGYYILPSSIHEMLLMPAEYSDYDARVLQRIVAEINETEVSPEDRLTDSIYYYDYSTDTFRKTA